MKPFEPSERKRRQLTLAPDELESRQLLTGGAGSTFAIFPGEVTNTAQPAALKFTLNPSQFTIPKGRVTLGIDIVKDPSSNLDPRIVSVTKQSGNRQEIQAMSRSLYAPNLPNSASLSSPFTSASTTTLRTDRRNPSQPVTYTVNVVGQHASAGKFLLGFYLPGDANGDGKVDSTDIAVIKSELGSKAGDAKYTFDADANRDGRINFTDLITAMRNNGAKTDVTPVVSAELDSASDTGIQDRVTTLPTVHFSGVATPGAAVKYEETAGKSAPMATTADANGNYSLYIGLGSGQNNFKVTTLDGFGQSISGTIAPVVYQTDSAAIQASFDALKQQASNASS